MTDQSQQDRLDNMVQGLFWWGIPTLFRCPHDPDPANCDIALVGVPHSTGNGTTLHDQHLGPRAVRNVSALGRRSHTRQFLLKICDSGHTCNQFGRVIPSNSAGFSRYARGKLGGAADSGYPGHWSDCRLHKYKI